MGKSLNHIGKTAGKHEQLLVSRQKKLEKQEEFNKIFDSYPVMESQDVWTCSACYSYYKYRDIHEKEWEEKTREIVR